MTSAKCQSFEPPTPPPPPLSSIGSCLPLSNFHISLNLIPPWRTSYVNMPPAVQLSLSKSFGPPRRRRPSTFGGPMTVSFRHFGFVAGPTPTERERRALPQPLEMQLSSGDVNLSPFHFLHEEEQTWYFKLRFPRLIRLAAKCVLACPITGYRVFERNRD